jgi:hypothetical protein
MSWTLRSFQTLTTWVIVLTWAVFCGFALAYADPLPTLDEALAFLVGPPLLWAYAARLVLSHWWSATGSRMAALDPPGRLLAMAVAALPEGRGQWGRAMTAELAEITERSARWRFALSSIRGTLWLRPAAGWPALAVVAASVVAAAVAAGPTIGAAVPGLQAFAVGFTGLLGAMVVLAVARARRLRLPVPDRPSW